MENMWEQQDWETIAFHGKHLGQEPSFSILVLQPHALHVLDAFLLQHI